MRLVLALLTAAAASACPRPPVGPPPPPPLPEGRVAPLAVELCIQDRPAISGKWYDYNPDGHTLNPKPQAWVLRDPSEDPPRYAALRIISVYEPDAVESGRFTFGVASHDGAGWSAESEWLTPRNMKDEDLCLDVFARAEVACDASSWQVRLAEFQYLSPRSGFSAQNLGVFARGWAGRPDLGDVRLARIDNVTALDSLPDPSTLVELTDAPAASWESTDWAFERLAPDLPEAGMALGRRFVDDGFVARDDVYFLFATRYELVRFTVRPSTDGEPDAGLRVSFSAIPVEFEDMSMPSDIPAPSEVDVPAPPPGTASYLSFRHPTLQPPAEDLVEAAYPFVRPRSSRFDLMIERLPDGATRLMLSPGTCVINASQTGLDTDSPPVSPQ